MGIFLLGTKFERSPLNRIKNRESCVGRMNFRKEGIAT